MNSCDYYQELISRLVDGEISREEHEALMAHMNTCSRCNAMYALFHDLSDILSEDPEPLPEGLHENIMAGVRRSEMIKKNRRMRKLGLRMAISAAACALLVLFAASGFGPGKRAEDVSLRTQEAAERFYQAPADTPALTEEIFTLAAQTPAPTSVWTAAPAETSAAFAAPDAYLAAGNSVSETQNTLQPEQYNANQYTAPASTPVPAQFYEPFTVQTPTPVAMQTPAPVAAQTPAPVAAQTPAPVAVQTPAPVAVQTPAPVAVQTPAALTVQAPAAVAVQTPEPIVAQTAAPVAAEDAEPPMLRKTELTLTASENTAFAVEEINIDETVENDAQIATRRNAPAVTESKTAVSEDEPQQLLFFDGLSVEFASDQPDAASDEVGIADNAVQNPILTQSVVPILDEANTTPDGAEVSAPKEQGDVREELPQEKTETKVEEQSVKVYGKDGHDRLLALLGGSESELPKEAELTRAVHVALLPDDAYGSEEKLEISIYGDFVYYRLYPVDGGAVSYRAACALRELDALLKELTVSASEPSPSPTIDPYTVEIPIA